MSTLLRGLRLTTPPVVEPVLFADVHPDHLKLTGGHEQTYVESLIAMAREEAEQFMRRALIDQSYTLTLDHWPGGSRDWWDDLHTPARTASDLYLELPYPPLDSVTSINTYDTADAVTPVVVATVFYVDTNTEPGRLVLRSGESWPIDTRRGGRIEIIYKVGYGASGADVPEAIKHGIKLHVAWMYEHRGDGAQTMESIYASGAAARYSGYRIMSL